MIGAGNEEQSQIKNVGGDLTSQTPPACAIGETRRPASPAGGRDGARGTIQALVAAVRFAAFRLGLFLRDRNLRSLKNSPRQSLKILASLRSFVVFVFHILLSVSLRTGFQENPIRKCMRTESKPAYRPQVLPSFSAENTKRALRAIRSKKRQQR
jgi:hypothetical protein